MDTLDTLISRIKSVSDDTIVQKLANEISNWKVSKDNVKQLESTIDRFIGTSWIAKDNHHEQVYSIWTDFKEESIKLIHGMTMNERLFAFSLMNKFDTCKTVEEQDLIYKKLLAKR